MLKTLEIEKAKAAYEAGDYNKAIELNHQPAAISITIMAAVIHITIRVPRSAAALLASARSKGYEGGDTGEAREWLAAYKAGAR